MDDAYHKENLAQAKTNQRKPNNTPITNSTKENKTITKDGEQKKQFNMIVQQTLTPNH